MECGSSNSADKEQSYPIENATDTSNQGLPGYDEAMNMPVPVVASLEIENEKDINSKTI